MIDPQLQAGTVRVKLADAVRSVNAANAATGTSENPGLDAAWLRLDRALSMATITGDPGAALLAIDRYRREGLAAIEQEA
jgi:hypothetical protein